jgi:3-dehydroquinate synthase
VAIGIALDVIYSRRMGYLDQNSEHRILRLLEILGFELYASELQHLDSENRLIVLNGLEEFREHLGGELTITLLRGIGRGFEAHEVDTAQMLRSIDELAVRHAQKAVESSQASA